MSSSPNPYRRSELVALDVADIEFTDDGLRVTIRRSKTDQEGQGATIAISRGGTSCPVKAVKAWLDAAGISEGPDLPSGSQGQQGAPIAAYGKERVRPHQKLCRLWRPPAGFLTSAARRGASVFKMSDVSRHKSMEVLQGYVRDADIFRDHAGASLL